ncbi:hypothetical protein DY000_02001463 [Brassica cretica]|uniref:Uncharacterized protein n=1 Tax=Brassica cretica TaxID=69181 RepID=A0ABQ7C5B2_BRACR|nr:hypothetical protein DY000_02001463 [Brassica cretica]
MPAIYSLSDIIGEICETMTTYDDQSHTTQCVMVNIRVDKDMIVCLSVFDSLTELLHKRLETGDVKEPETVSLAELTTYFLESPPQELQTDGATSHVPSVSENYSVKFPNTSDVNVLRFGCIVASDAAMTNVTNVRAVEVPHLMGQGEEQDPRNPSKKAWT